MTNIELMNEIISQLRCDIVINQNQLTTPILHKAIEKVCVGDEYGREISPVDKEILDHIYYVKGAFKASKVETDLQFSKTESYMYHISASFDTRKMYDNNYINVLIPIRTERYGYDINTLVRYLVDNKMEGYVRAYKKYKDAVQLKIKHNKKTYENLNELSYLLNLGNINPLSATDSQIVVTSKVRELESQIKCAEQLLKQGIENLSTKNKTIWTATPKDVISTTLELPVTPEQRQIFNHLLQDKTIISVPRETKIQNKQKEIQLKPN